MYRNWKKDAMHTANAAKLANPIQLYNTGDPQRISRFYHVKIVQFLLFYA